MSGIEIHPRIKEAIRHNSLILFIGSGYSRNLSLPNWLGLARKFVDVLAEEDDALQSLRVEAREPKANALNILNALFNRGYQGECKEMLQETIDIDVSKCDLQNQQKIWQLSRKVITTNYDRALEGALTDDQKEEVETYTPADNIFGLSGLRDLQYLFKIHGTIDRRDGCVLFQEDYDRLYKHNHHFLEQLKGMCVNSTILFIGYSIGDIELQQILKHIKSLFHESTAHFTLTTDKKTFEPFGVDALPLKDHDQLMPYVDALIAYRRSVDAAVRDIEQKVALKYAGSNNVLDSFAKQTESDREKECFRRAEDRREIRLLESLGSVDAQTSEKRLMALIEAGKEDQVSTFLLLKRYARRQKTWAYFRHLENRPDSSNLRFALEEYTGALKIAVELFARDDSELLNLYNEIGECHMRLDNFDEAENFYREALAIATREKSPDPVSLGTIYANLGTLERAKGAPDKTLEYHQSVVALDAAAGERGLHFMRVAAMSFVKAKRFSESIVLLEQIMRDDQAPVLVRANDNKALGLAYSKMNRHRESVSCYEQAAKLFVDYYGEANARFLDFYNDIGYGCLLIQEYQKAIDYFKKAIALERNDETIYITKNNMGEAYYKAGDFKMAKKTYEDNFAFLQSKIGEKDHPEAYSFSRQKIRECTDRLQGV